MLGSHICDPASATICDAENVEVATQKPQFPTTRQISWSITTSARPSLALVAVVCDHRRWSEERSRSDRLRIAAYCTFRRLHAGSHREAVLSTCDVLRWLLHCRSTAPRLQFDFPTMSKNDHGSDVTAIYCITLQNSHHFCAMYVEEPKLKKKKKWNWKHNFLVLFLDYDFILWKNTDI